MNLRKYLPFDNFTLVSPLSPEELKRKLDNAVRSYSGNAKEGDKHKNYKGKVSVDSFQITRIPQGRNSFIPIVEGRFSPGMKETRIQIKMRLQTFVLLFMCFWISIVGSVCLGLLVGAIWNIRKMFKGEFSAPVLIPFVMLVFGFLIMSMGYGSERTETKWFLKEVLEAKEVEVA